MEGLHVLVADDHELIRLMIGRALTRMGCSCVFAVDGAEAVARALAARYDLIVTDLAMPLLDGFGLIRKVRESETNAETPILVVSSREHDPEAFLRAHAVQGFLPKPFNVDELQQAVEDIAGRPLARVYTTQRR